jgi:hypothetical protein
MKTPLSVQICCRVIPALVGASLGAYAWGGSWGGGAECAQVTSNGAALIAAIAVACGMGIETRLHEFYRSQARQELSDERRSAASGIRNLSGSDEFDSDQRATLARAAQILEERQ